MREMVPKDPSDAIQKVGQTVDDAVQDFNNKFEDRLKEDSTGQKKTSVPEAEAEANQPGVLESARNKIYNVTQPEEERKLLEDANKSMTQKLKESMALSVNSALNMVEPKLDKAQDKVSSAADHVQEEVNSP